MKNYYLLLILLWFIACTQPVKELKSFKKYDETSEIALQKEHENARMQFKLIQSKVLDMNEVFMPFQQELSNFAEDEYQKISPFILEKTIPSIQQSIKDGNLSYEKLTLFYLYRIHKFESNSTKYLNAIISLNPSILDEAKAKDVYAKKNKIDNESVFGMPILLKDNINTQKMPTTAGALALQNNNTQDAFIVKQLKKEGALILGKVNLSEWAYYFCSGCPLGYSSVGGQTLNPYGRKIFETGGSSAGSGVATAANYAVATIGTETAGSITSPSSLNSVVGLKPTIGVLSRGGIVPISSTLDTPGPMTKNVTDNFILFKALLGCDVQDEKSIELSDIDTSLKETSLKGKRLGVFTSLLTDSIYKKTITNIKNAGVEIIEISPSQTSLKGFLTLLNIDMKHDLPAYLESTKMSVKSVNDVIVFNKKDSLVRAPYGQQLFEGIVNDSTSIAQLTVIKNQLKNEGITYFNAFKAHSLDAILSINNYHAAYSAVAEYPNLTVPMGYKNNGEPISLTFIGLPQSEFKLLSLAKAYETLQPIRKLPENYK
ncbi:amidase family protein [Tenacibaculum geojense]|uniref:Amidase family protein n=1 Tax=Tenacibaculum geojense TaxID=915352 RepID=A0ABW3JSF4_9FLAO